MNYDARSTTSRQDLATRIASALKAEGFVPEVRPRTREEVFALALPGGIRILVYTSVADGKARRVGKDAIRVCAVYKGADGKDRGLARADKRVNRVGTIDAIVGRTISRIEDVRKIARKPERCPECGAPKFKSKKGNLVCADLCWTNAPTPKPAPAPRPSEAGYFVPAGTKGWVAKNNDPWVAYTTRHDVNMEKPIAKTDEGHLIFETLKGGSKWYLKVREDQVQ